MIVRNSIVENLRWMPPKTAEEIKEARENLIDDVMHTCFADDMDDEESANRAYLETLSNDGLQEMIDEWNNYDGVNYYGIDIPESLVQTTRHLNWDNKIPVVTNSKVELSTHHTLVIIDYLVSS